MNAIVRRYARRLAWAGAALLLSALGAAGGEPMEPPSSGRESDYLVTVWQTDDGLPQNEVTSLAQTPEGYLWIGLLHGGLARFDGSRFTLFTPFNTPELRAIEVLQLATDERGVLWIGPSDGSLTTWSSGRFTLQRPAQSSGGLRLQSVVSSSSNQVVLAAINCSLMVGSLGSNSAAWQVWVPPSADRYTALCADRTGAIWYRTMQNGLGRFDGQGFASAAPTTDPLMQSVIALCAAPGGQVMVGTSNGITACGDNQLQECTPTNGPVPLNVSRLVSARDGGLWVLEGDWIRKCMGRRWTVQAKLPGFRLSRLGGNLFADAEGGVWLVGLDEALWHVSPTGRLEKFSEKEGLPTTEITAWLQDREGNIWLGTANSGLVRLRRRLFRSLDTATLPNKVIRSLAEDEAGQVWVGTGSGEVYSLGKEGWVPLNLDPVYRGTKSDAVVCPDRAGRLWISTMQSGVLLKQGAQLRRPFPVGAVGAGARVIHADQQGRVWFGSEFGLHCWQDGSLRAFTPEEIGRPCHVTGIAEDSTGNIWITTAGCELFRFSNNVLTRFHSPNDFIKSRFWCVLPDADGRVWIGTLGGGLVCFKDGKFTRLTTDNRLPDNNICQLLDDGQGRLWCGSWNGIFCLHKADIRRFLDGETENISREAYGRSDGLPTLECSGGFQPACLRARDGRLWFSTMKGPVWVDPRTESNRPSAPEVLLEEIWVDGRRVYPEASHRQEASNSRSERTSAVAHFTDSGSLRVAPGRRSLDFSFVGMNLGSPEKVRYRCKLDGVDPEWRYIDRNRHNHYTGLPPGKFTFVAQASMDNATWSQAGARLSLTILPHFWQTWWFIGVLAGCVLALLLGLHALRLSRMRQIERLRLRIARDLHDEVGAGLGTIALLGELIEEDYGVKDGTKVRQLALQTIDALRDIVWFIDPTFERLDDLVQRIEAVARAMLPGLELKFLPVGDFNSCDLPLGLRRNVIPLLKESLRNVTRHAKAKRVEIRVQRQKGFFQLEIADNGIGFDAVSPTPGNGLKNIRQRAAAMNGQIEVQSSPGVGTRITLTAPIP